MSDALPLPPRPDLEQYKKLARDLQDACQSNDPDATRQWATRWVETLARLCEPTGWADARVGGTKPDQIVRRWKTVQEKSGDAAGCKLAAVQFFVAREHGFASWPKFARHVQEIARANSPISTFEAAANAIVDGDAPTLRHLLAVNSGLIHERSTREHHSTLLHYVSANGVEDFRQKTPRNIVEITRILLDAGAEVDAGSDAYGGSTTLGLAATSVHPEKAGVQIDLLKLLLDRGANLHHSTAGGNQHSIVHGCIANGQPAAARFLADLGAPLDPESAAAVGRLDVLASFFDSSGALRPGTTTKQVESALLYACGYGSLDAARFLLERRIDPETADDHGQTALHWSTWTPQIESVRLLLERGARVDVRDHRFQATPLDSALWTWSKASKDEDREPCYEVVARLVRAGARLDRDFWLDPGKDRSAMLDRIDSDPRMLPALRGEMPS